MSATSMFRRLFKSRTRTVRHPQPPRRHQLGIETLERRDCPAVTANLVGTVLTVQGTDASDDITVYQLYPLIGVHTQQNGVTSHVGRVYYDWEITSISISGLGSGDTIRNATDKPSVLSGDTGRDTVYGGSGDDQIFGGSNDDLLYGRDGNDILSGEQGADQLFGASDYVTGAETGPANDTLQGGDGPDRLYGGYGADLLIGGNDNDWLEGQWGNDVVVGSKWDFATNTPIASEDVTVPGYTTNDILFGQNGYDTLLGGAGNDNLSGGNNSDLLYGQEGNDQLWGAFWDSTIEKVGEPNDDTILGGNGFDSLYGGIGRDWLFGEEDNDRLYGQEDGDALDGGKGNDTLDGGAGNDNLVGGPDSDSLYGGPDADTLWGAAWQNNYTDEDGNYLYLDGSNLLSGGTEGDNLYGGNGYDYIVGGAGDDGLFGGLGYNRLFGGPDDDRFLTWTSATDSVEDLAGNDAVLRFNDTTATTVRYSNEVDPATGQPIEAPLRYAAARWTAQEITTVDGGLDFAHRLTGNTRFLKQNITLYGNLLFTVQEFTREGAYIPWTDAEVAVEADALAAVAAVLGTDPATPTRQVANVRGPGYGGWNGDTGIVVNDFGVSLGAESVQETVFHELGHNWSDEGSPVWSDWLHASGWTDTFPYWEFFNYTVSGDGRWWYANTADGTFYRDYSTFNPLEDWSTTLEAYRLNRLGGGRLDAATADRLAAKFAIIDKLVQQLSLG